MFIILFLFVSEALATVKIKHMPDTSNFLSVSMATEEDFAIFPNLISVHGHEFSTPDTAREKVIPEATGRDGTYKNA